MNTNMETTVAIVCSNDHLIKKCLDSIPKNTKIIVVLNFPDNYVLETVKNDKRIKICRCDERNLGKLRQIAIDNCKTPAILFVDSDCILEKDTISIVEKELENAYAVNIPLHFAYNNYSTKIVSLCRKYTTPDSLLYMPFAFRISIQNKIGKLFNDKLYWGEDSDQRKRMKEKNIDYIISKSFITHKVLTIKEDAKSSMRLGVGTYVQEINNINKKRSFLKDISIFHEIVYAIKCHIMTHSLMAGLYHFFIWRPTYKYGYWKEKFKNGNKSKNN